MGLPPANTVLFFLAAFLTLWGLSVIVRAARFAAIPGTRRCPECRHDMRGVPGRRCPSCGYEPARETDLLERTKDPKRSPVGSAASVCGVLLFPVAISVYRWEQSDWLGIGPINAAFWGVAVFGLTVAIWGWRGDRARGRRRCPKCWYDMSATLAIPDAPLTCPECGHDPTTTRSLYRPRRRPKVALLGAFLIAVGVYGQSVPRALDYGPTGLIPTTLMIAGARWLPVSWYADATTPFIVSEFSVRLSEDSWEWQRRWAAATMREIAMTTRDPQRLRMGLGYAEPDSGESASALVSEVMMALAGARSNTWTEADRVAVEQGLDAFIRNTQSGGGFSNGSDWDPELLDALIQTDSAVCLRSAFWLVQQLSMQPSERSVERLWEHAGSEDTGVADNASLIIAHHCGTSSSTSDDWIDHSRSTDPQTRAIAARVAAWGRRPTDLFIHRLTEMLTQETDSEVLSQVIRSLIIQDSDGDWVPQIERLITASEPDRWRLLDAVLPQHSWLSRRRVGLVARLSASESPRVRACAVWVLARFWSSVPEAYASRYQMTDSGWSAIVARLDDPDPRVARIAAKAVLDLRDTYTDRFVELFPEAVARANEMDADGVTFDPTAFDEPPSDPPPPTVNSDG